MVLVSISDLLGTAGLEARAADRIIESIRDGSTSSRLASIDDARECAVQLLSEIEVARNRMHGWHQFTGNQPSDTFMGERVESYEDACEYTAEKIRAALEAYDD